MSKREKIREIFNRLKDGEYLHVKNGLGQGMSFSIDWNGSWKNSYLRCAHYGYWAHKATIGNLKYELERIGCYDVESAEEYEARTGEKFFYWGL